MATFSSMCVPDQQFRADNHYLPCVSSKHFANATGDLCVYRTLVSHPNVHVWDDKAPGSIAWIERLYTRTVDGQESDEIERWFEREVETPASEAIDLIVSDAKLRPDQWDALIRFAAAQSVRTPAFLARNYPNWSKDMPPIVDSVLDELASNGDAAKRVEQGSELSAGQLFAKYVPVRVLSQPAQERGMAEVKVEILMGRGYWHFAMEHALTNTVEVLRKHKWSVVKPCEGLTWFTSDDPVILLNSSADGSYNFGGGWGSHGSQILLPLSPSHLLYTTVGQKPLLRGTRLDRTGTQFVRKVIAEHAHAHIFAANRDEEVSMLRPRVVSESGHRQYREIWKNFAQEQARTEAIWANSDAA